MSVGIRVGIEVGKDEGISEPHEYEYNDQDKSVVTISLFGQLEEYTHASSRMLRNPFGL